VEVLYQYSVSWGPGVISFFRLTVSP
jgi:hypothetical protein